MAEITTGTTTPEKTTPAVAPAPPAPVEKEEVAVERSEVEQRAMDQGWDPDYEGENKRTAREFLDRGELLGKIKSQSSELREIKAALQGLSEHNKQVYQAGYQKALTDLRAQKVKAVNEGDGARVVQLDEQIDQTRSALALVNSQVQASKQAPGQTEEFTEFLEKNSWYNDSRKMKAWAHGIAIDYAKEHTDATEKQVYDYISREVKKEFPERYTKGAPPSPDGEGRSVRGTVSNKGAGSFEKLMSELPEDQARVAKDLVKRGLLTKEKYVEDYETMGRN